MGFVFWILATLPLFVTPTPLPPGPLPPGPPPPSSPWTIKNVEITSRDYDDCVNDLKPGQLVSSISSINLGCKVICSVVDIRLDDDDASRYFEITKLFSNVSCTFEAECIGGECIPSSVIVEPANPSILDTPLINVEEPLPIPDIKILEQRTEKNDNFDEEFDLLFDLHDYEFQTCVDNIPKNDILTYVKREKEGCLLACSYMNPKKDSDDPFKRAITRIPLSDVPCTGENRRCWNGRCVSTSLIPQSQFPELPSHNFTISEEDHFMECIQSVGKASVITNLRRSDHGCKMHCSMYDNYKKDYSTRIEKKLRVSKVNLSNRPCNRDRGNCISGSCIYAGYPCDIRNMTLPEAKVWLDVAKLITQDHEFERKIDSIANECLNIQTICNSGFYKWVIKTIYAAWIGRIPEIIFKTKCKIDLSNCKAVLCRMTDVLDYDNGNSKFPILANLQAGHKQLNWTAN